MNYMEIELSMVDLFHVLGAQSIDYELAFDINDLDIHVQSPTGWQPIQALVRKHVEGSTYYLSDDTSITCANQHLVFEHGVCKPIQTCNYVDTMAGLNQIVGSELHGLMDLYDIALPPPHKYVCSKGIIHHNTSLAFMLMDLLHVDKGDIKFVNGCVDNGIDVVRDLENFVSTMPMGEYRYVIIDEFDYFSPNGQAGLKNMMETYSAGARFIFTANLSHKIIPPIKSRCQSFEIQSVDRQLYFERIATILVEEGVMLDENNLAVLDDYVDVAYPDLRKCINMLQQNCVNGELKRPGGDTVAGNSEYMVQAVSLFKEGRITDARKLISGKVQPNEYEELYKLLYRNLDWWGTTEKQQNAAIVIIANRLRDHSIAADPEINMSACLVELSMVAE